jgi:hypothetical protein
MFCLRGQSNFTLGAVPVTRNPLDQALHRLTENVTLKP